MPTIHWPSSHAVKNIVHSVRHCYATTHHSLIFASFVQEPDGLHATYYSTAEVASITHFKYNIIMYNLKPYRICTYKSTNNQMLYNLFIRLPYNFAFLILWFVFEHNIQQHTYRIYIGVPITQRTPQNRIAKKKKKTLRFIFPGYVCCCNLSFTCLLIHYLHDKLLLNIVVGLMIIRWMNKKKKKPAKKLYWELSMVLIDAMKSIICFFSTAC